MRSVRNHLILSHVVPLLVIIPLVGIALVYVLETRVVLVNLARQLTGQAVLVAELAREEPAIWSDALQAQAFVDRVGPLFPGQLMLLDRSGNVLASSDPADAGILGRPVELPGLDQALAGERYTRIHYSQNARAEVADVMVPATGANGQVNGVVRLTDQFGTVYERFLRLRTLIAAVLAGGLLVGAAVGWLLALTLERPLHGLTEAVGRLAAGQQWAPVPEQGPEETRLLLRAFNSLVERLRALEEARRHLLANLMHELGRPLGALHSAAQALRGGAAEDVALREELLVGMEAEIARLQRLLDDLAGLHERPLGTLELDRRPTPLGPWLGRVLAPWREAATQKGVEWRVTIPPSLPSVLIDPDRLAQALGNLLSNAIKYTPPDGAISVSVEVEDEGVTILVSDTGPGIAPEAQARIFEPFFRAQTDRRFPQGMGLGLTIARDLALAHGGRLDVRSTPGAGSDFTLRLPLDPARAQSH